MPKETDEKIVLEEGQHRPETFNTIKEALEWHKGRGVGASVTGWFIVDGVVYWTYGGNDYNLTTMSVETAKGSINLED